jgi:hypothetical protein
MAEGCPRSSDTYFAYLNATRTTAAELARARAALGAVPDLGAAAAGTTFQSPAVDRLGRDVTGIGVGLRDADGRLAELIGFLQRIADKYDQLYHQALVHESQMAEASEP